MINCFETHNVDITAPIAVYCVNVRNGTVWDQGPVSEVMAANKHLRTAAEVTDEATEKVEDLVAAKEVTKTEGGKLIVSEEVAIGHVSWRSSAYLFHLATSAPTYLAYSEALLRGLDWKSYNTPLTGP